MPASNLSNDAKKALLELQKQTKIFLKQFSTLEKGGTEYLKYKAKKDGIQALYLAISLMDLTLTEETVVKEEEKEVTPVVEKKETPKEEKKARREKRKEENKSKRDERKAAREAMKIERQKQNNDESGSKEEGKFRYDELMATWNTFKFDEITSNFRDYLNDAEAFVIKANNFIGYVESFAEGHFIQEVEQMKEIIEKAQKFLAIARNIAAQVDRYAKLAQKVIEITQKIPRTVEELKGNVLTEAQKIFAAAKQFIAVADTNDDELKSGVEKMQGYLKRGQEKLGDLEKLVGLALADEDGNNLPDWYDKLSAKYDELMKGGTNLIPGTDIDDKILLKITALKGSLDRFVAAASDKVEELDLQEKMKNVQQWIGELSKFISAITGFVENIKAGDLEGIYKDLKDFKNFIDSDKDILEGTKIDDKIKKLLKENSKKAESYLMNLVTGGDPSKEGEVKEILGLLDTLLLSSGEVVDHSSKFEKDEDKINLPEVTAVSEDEAKELMEKYGIKKADASFEGILSDMKDEADTVMGEVNKKYAAALKRGAMASDAFKAAKEEYDQALKAHEDYFKATNELGKKIILGLVGLAASALSPAVASVVSAGAAALLGDFDQLNGKIKELLPEELGFVGDLATEIIPSVLPRWASEEGLIKIDGKELLKGLDELYQSGISFRYKEVYGLLNNMKGKAKGVGKNLRGVEQAESVDPDKLKEVKNDVLILAKKWAMLEKDIDKKYIKLPYPPIDKPKAYRNGSRYLYAIWLIKFPQKEIRIGNSMIKQFEKFGVISEAKVKWSTGKGAEFSRSFTGFCGADPFDYRKELKKMKDWASKEVDRLKTAKAWSKVF